MASGPTRCQVAAHCRDLLYDLGHSEQAAQVACRRLLLHGNQLLDAEAKCLRARKQLDELASLVVAGKAVEVTQRWRVQVRCPSDYGRRPMQPPVPVLRPTLSHIVSTRTATPAAICITVTSWSHHGHITVASR